MPYVEIQQDVDCHILYSWDRPELQTFATISLCDLHFDTYFRLRLILLLMGLCFAAVFRKAT